MRGSILFPFFRLLFFDLVGRFLELFELSLPSVLRRESPSKVFKGDGMRIKKKIFFIYIEIDAPMIIFSRFLLFSGLCAACMLARVEQERLESLKYDRATIYIKCVEDNEDTKSENDSEVRIS